MSLDHADNADARPSTVPPDAAREVARDARAREGAPRSSGWRRAPMPADWRGTWREAAYLRGARDRAAADRLGLAGRRVARALGMLEAEGLTAADLAALVAAADARGEAAPLVARSVAR